MFEVISLDELNYKTFLEAVRCDDIEIIKWLGEQLVTASRKSASDQIYIYLLSGVNINNRYVGKVCDVVSRFLGKFTYGYTVATEIRNIIHTVIPIDLRKIVTNEAVKAGNLEIVKYVHDFFYPVNKNDMIIALSHYHYPIIEWMHNIVGIRLETRDIILNISDDEEVCNDDNRKKYSLDILKWIWENYHEALTFEIARILTLQENSMEYFRLSDIIFVVHGKNPLGLDNFLRRIKYISHERTFESSSMNNPNAWLDINFDFLRLYQRHYPVLQEKYLHYYLFSVICYNKPLTEFLWNLAIKEYIRKCLKPGRYKSEIQSLKDLVTPYARRIAYIPNWLSNLCPEMYHLILQCGPFSTLPPIEEIINPPFPYRDYMRMLDKLIENREREQQYLYITDNRITTQCFFNKTKKSFVTLEYFDKLFRLGLVYVKVNKNGFVTGFRNFPRNNYHFLRYMSFMMSPFRIAKNEAFERDMCTTIIDCLRMRSKDLFRTIRWYYHHVINERYTTRFGTITDSHDDKLNTTELCEFIDSIPLCKLRTLSEKFENKLIRAIKDAIVSENLLELITSDISRQDAYELMIRAIKLKKKEMLVFLCKNEECLRMLINSPYLQQNWTKRLWVEETMNVKIT